jgi:hypothetical protein
MNVEELGKSLDVNGIQYQEEIACCVKRLGPCDVMGDFLYITMMDGNTAIASLGGEVLAIGPSIVVSKFFITYPVGYIPCSRDDLS